MCVSSSWKWRVAAGQPEHSLVKKSIKEKQRGSRGQKYFSSQQFLFFSFLQCLEQLQQMSARIIYKHNSSPWSERRRSPRLWLCFLRNLTSKTVVANTQFHTCSPIFSGPRVEKKGRNWGWCFFLFFTPSGLGSNLKQTHTLDDKAVSAAL